MVMQAVLSRFMQKCEHSLVSPEGYGSNGVFLRLWQVRRLQDSGCPHYNCDSDIQASFSQGTVGGKAKRALGCQNL
jgi:hypothetical protein